MQLYFKPTTAKMLGNLKVCLAGKLRDASQKQFLFAVIYVVSNHLNLIMGMYSRPLLPRCWFQKLLRLSKSLWHAALASSAGCLGSCAVIKKWFQTTHCHEKSSVNIFIASTSENRKCFPVKWFALLADLGDCFADEVHTEAALQHIPVGGSGVADGGNHSQSAQQLRVTYACFMLCIVPML